MSLNITTTTSHLNSKNLSCFTLFVIFLVQNVIIAHSFIDHYCHQQSPGNLLSHQSLPTVPTLQATTVDLSLSNRYTLSSRVIGQKAPGVLSLEYKYGQLLRFASTALCLCFTNNINRAVDHNCQYLPSNRSP